MGANDLAMTGAGSESFPNRADTAPNLAAQAYTHLRSLILGRRILGGTGLSEARLATELNVSRTPMREALVRLAGEGLLEKTADGYFRVRAVSIREFFECMEVREVLECHAIERAIGMVREADVQALMDALRTLPAATDDDFAHWQFDNRFHAFFATAARNQALARAIQRERVVARLFRLSSPYHRQSESDDEHVEILEAVMRRDVASAQAAMRRHLRNLQDDTRRAIENEAYLRPQESAWDLGS
ncbi:MAG: GntR family transcriptional regulator [Rubrivivax sp.]